MAQTHFMFRIDIGFSEGRGYAATVLDVANNRIKGIKGHSIRQLLRRVHEVVAEEEQKKRRFPLESEPASTRSIITPESNDPLFNGI